MQATPHLLLQKKFHLLGGGGMGGRAHRRVEAGAACRQETHARASTCACPTVSDGRHFYEWSREYCAVCVCVLQPQPDWSSRQLGHGGMRDCCIWPPAAGQTVPETSAAICSHLQPVVHAGVMVPQVPAIAHPSSHRTPLHVHPNFHRRPLPASTGGMHGPCSPWW